MKMASRIVRMDWVEDDPKKMGVVSRLPMVLVMSGMDHARVDGLSKHVGRPNTRQAVAALVLVSVLCLIILGWWALLLLPVVLASS